MKNCDRCKIAQYCGDSSSCKDLDKDNHKKSCSQVSYLQQLIPRIERNFYDFNLRDINDYEGTPFEAQFAKMMEMGKFHHEAK